MSFKVTELSYNETEITFNFLTNNLYVKTSKMQLL